MFVRTRRRSSQSAALAWVASVAVVAWSAVPLAALAYRTLRHGGVLSGADGALAGPDQLLYMDWIRQSGQHLLIADRFDLVIGRPVFLQPLYLLFGLAWRAGISIQAAFWLLQLLAAPVLAVGGVTLVARCLPGQRQRALALALALMYLSPLVPLLAWTGAVSGAQRFELILPGGESMPAWQLWGYPHVALAVGLLALALTGTVTLASGARGSRWLLPAISGAVLTVGWLHAWQGLVFIVIAVLLALEQRSWRLARALSLPIAAASAPILYQEVLVHADSAWRINATQSTVGHVPAWMLLVVFAPLALPALAGLRALPPGPLRTVLAAWPLTAAAIYFATSEFPYHALEGISIPLAVLAVAGWPRAAGAARAGVIAVAVTLGTAGAYEALTFRDSVRSHLAPYWMAAGERQALAYLDHAALRGGVLARYYLAMTVPAFTGRRTWVGEWSWTPDFSRRQQLVEQLMGGRMSPSQARDFVRSTGARFALSDCGTHAPLDRLLGPLVTFTRSFGCAQVYALRDPAAGSGRYAYSRASTMPTGQLTPVPPRPQ